MVSFKFGRLISNPSSRLFLFVYSVNIGTISF
jgi:hypothetical protein